MNPDNVITFAVAANALIALLLVNNKPGTTKVKPALVGIVIIMFWSGTVAPPYSTVKTTSAV